MSIIEQRNKYHYKTFKNLLEVFVHARQYLIDSETSNMTFEIFVDLYGVQKHPGCFEVSVERIKFYCIDTRNNNQVVFVIFRSSPFRNNRADLNFIKKIFDYNSQDSLRFKRLIIVFDTSDRSFSGKRTGVRDLFCKSVGRLMLGHCRTKRGITVIIAEHILSKDVFSMTTIVEQFKMKKTFLMIEQTSDDYEDDDNQYICYNYGENEDYTPDEEVPNVVNLNYFEQNKSNVKKFKKYKAVSNPNSQISSHIEILNEEEKESLFKMVCKSQFSRIKSLPKIRTWDPLTKVIGASVGDILKLTRRSETSGRIVSFREVI